MIKLSYIALSISNKKKLKTTTFLDIENILKTNSNKVITAISIIIK
jgi:hypothetical protein